MPGITDAVAIGLGHDHACAVHATTGTVSCWGNNSDGQLGTGIAGCPDGSWDCASPGQLVVGLSGITQIAGSYVHTCAVQNSGQVYCFGWLPTLDGSGAVTRHDVLSPEAVSGLADAVQVSTNEVTDDVDCAVRRSGEIVCWGTASVTPVPVSGLP
jgi:alpha-tubulin suppressor-like RCC1 family protein